MANDSGSGGLGARLLVIVYAASLVAIGAYPIRQEYGSVVSFLRKEVEELRRDAPRFDWARSNSGNSKEAKLVIGGASSGNEKLAKRGSPPVEKDMDRLTSNDKQQLENLLTTLK